MNEDILIHLDELQHVNMVNIFVYIRFISLYFLLKKNP